MTIVKTREYFQKMAMIKENTKRHTGKPLCLKFQQITNEYRRILKKVKKNFRKDRIKQYEVI